ncbi:hypothetical protein [Thermomonospora umbrina]|nr:hypothetical protein [Thermomonospora umbrina]
MGEGSRNRRARGPRDDITHAEVTRRFPDAARLAASIRALAAHDVDTKVIVDDATGAAIAHAITRDGELVVNGTVFTDASLPVLHSSLDGSPRMQELLDVLNGIRRGWTEPGPRLHIRRPDATA